MMASSVGFHRYEYCDAPAAEVFDFYEARAAIRLMTDLDLKKHGRNCGSAVRAAGK
jgi:hypothetical protein